MAEAQSALIGFAFGTLNLHRLEADVEPRNLRSIGLLEGAGFRREGFLRERYHLNGEIQDALFYGPFAPRIRRRGGLTSVRTGHATRRFCHPRPRGGPADYRLRRVLTVEDV